VRLAACRGERAPLASALLYGGLEHAAFPGPGGAEVGVHVPRGFDATRKPGMVVYFHGWQGCVGAALADGDEACDEGGDPRPGGALVAQVDAARVNALLVAVELRVDLSTGEPGQLAMPGGLRSLLHEVLTERLAGPLGCTLDVDGLDRVMVVAHSGGYQAAAAVLQFGDVPQIQDVALLDALYGADEVFTAWARGAVTLYDPPTRGPRRFANLYTCCGGTVDRSRAMARLARDEAVAAGWPSAVYDGDDIDEPSPDELAHPVVSKRVASSHSELPRQYARVLIESAGFERIGAE
jgi:hypothetical protein